MISRLFLLLLLQLLLLIVKQTLSTPPSSQPSSSPSRQPTSQPSKQPVSSPTSQPSSQPSSSPSNEPSSQPSSSPSRQPTSQPSKQPVSSPTAQPTSEPSHIVTLRSWQRKYAEVYRNILVDNSIIYSDLNFGSDQFQYGGCGEWNLFVKDNIKTSLLGNYSFTAVTMAIVDTTSFLYPITSIKCSKSDKAQTIALSLIESINTSKKYDIECDGHLWRIKSCSKMPALCIDCEDPCLALCNPAETFFAAPCVKTSVIAKNCSHNSYAYWNNRYDSIHTIMFERSNAHIPNFTSIVVASVMQNKIEIEIALNMDGLVYCGALLQMPQSIVEVENKNLFVSLKRATNGIIVLNNLIPSTRYFIACFTKSTSLVTMSYNQIRVINVWTKCCRTALVAIEPINFRSKTTTLNALTVSVDALPYEALTVRIELLSFAPTPLPSSQPSSKPTSQPFSKPTSQPSQQPFSTPTSQPTSKPSTSKTTSPFKPRSLTGSLVVSPSAFYPNVITFSKESLTKISCIFSLPANYFSGYFELVVTLEGSSALNYTADIPNTVIVVHDNIKTPKAPEVVEVRFGNSGTFIDVVFDQQTNKGGLKSTFNCFLLFEFEFSNKSQCVWKDPFLIKIYPIYGLKVGDIIKIKGNLIKAAECSNAVKDICWKAMETVVTKVLAPVSPDIPVIVASIPKVIGSCQNLTIDLSNSFNLCGKDLMQLEIRAYSESAGIDTLQSFIDSSINGSSFIVIPYSLFRQNSEYIFTINGCNFFEVCSTIVHKVFVLDYIIPYVSIDGSSTRKMLVSSQLNVKVETMLPLCSTLLNQDEGDLTIQWGLYDVNRFLLTDFDRVTNKATWSDNPSNFILPAFSLTPNSIYELRVTTSYMLNGKILSGKSSINILTRIGNIIPIIKGVSGSINIGSSITLDASGSYDEDQQLTGVKVLRFVWKCIKIVPEIENRCLLDSNNNYNATIIFYARLLESLDTTSLITLTIHDPQSGRVASTSVNVIVTSPTSPTSIIEMLSPHSFWGSDFLVNPDEKLKLRASVKFLSNSSSRKLSWTNSELNLKDVALTPLDIVVSNTENYVLYDFALPSFTLSKSSKFDFTLKIDIGVLYSNSITVFTNGAPMPGSLRVIPSLGVELITDFLFSAKNWDDDDLPLTYSFGFSKSSKFNEFDVNILRVPREKSLFQTKLLSNRSPNNHLDNLTIVAYVYDAFNAREVAIQTVFVDRSTLSVKDLRLSILSSIQKSSNDDMQSLLSIGVSLMNLVNCTNAVNCNTLYNRNECSKKSNTCGSCLNGYFGVQGDSNSQCIRKGTRKLLSTSKQCNIADCSNKGKCIFYQIYTGQRVTACLLSDPYCQSKCLCNEGYYGESFSLDKMTMQSKQGMREIILSKFANFFLNEFPSKAILSSAVNTINRICETSDELTNTASIRVIDLSNYIMIEALKLKSFFGVENLVLDNVNIAISAILSGDNGSLKNSKSLGLIENILASYGALISNNIVIGEPDVTYSSTYFRIVTTIQNPSIPISSLSLPKTFFETIANKFVPTVLLPHLKGSTSSITLVSLNGLLFDNLKYLSNPMQLIINNIDINHPSVEKGYIFETTLELRNPTKLREYSVPLIDQTYCYEKDYSIYNYVCSKKDVYYNGYYWEEPSIISNEEVFCDGKKGLHQTRCAYDVPTYFCANLNNYLNSTFLNDCKVSSWDETSFSYVNCTCKLNAKNASSHTFFKLSYVSTLSNVRKNNFSKYTAIESYNNNKKYTESDIVFVTVGSAVFIFLVSIIYSIIADFIARQLMKRKVRLDELLNEKDTKDELSSSDLDYTINVTNNSNSYSATAFSKIAKITDLEIISNVDLALPVLLQPNISWFIKIINDLRKKHKYLSIYFHYSKSYSRMLRVVYSFTAGILIIFSISFAYDITSHDDGSCSQLEDQKKCMTSNHTCFWDESVQKCYPSFDNSTLETIGSPILVLVSTLIIIAPIKVYMIENIIVNWIRPPIKLWAIQPSSFNIFRLFRRKRNARRVYVSDNSIDDNFMLLLQRKLRFIADSLTTKNVGVKFLAAWGLDSNYRFVAFNEANTNSSEIILTKLENIRCERLNLLKKLRDKTNTVTDIRNTLLQFFLRDLLRLHGKETLSLEFNENYINNHNDDKITTTLSYRLLGLVYIICINAAMIYYILVQTLQPIERQVVWLNTVISTLLVDAIILNTLKVLLMNTLVYFYVFCDDIKDARMITITALSEFIKSKQTASSQPVQLHDDLSQLALTDFVDKSISLDSIISGNSLQLAPTLTPSVSLASSNFKTNMLSYIETDMEIIQSSINATEYFFISRAIAKAYPGMIESQFILNFTIPWPIKMRFHRQDYRPQLNYHIDDNKIKNKSKMAKFYSFWFNRLFKLSAKQIKFFCSILSVIILSIVIVLIISRVRKFKGHYGPYFSEIKIKYNKLILY